MAWINLLLFFNDPEKSSLKNSTLVFSVLICFLTLVPNYSESHWNPTFCVHLCMCMLLPLLFSASYFIYLITTTPRNNPDPKLGSSRAGLQGSEDIHVSAAWVAGVALVWHLFSGVRLTGGLSTEPAQSSHTWRGFCLVLVLFPALCFSTYIKSAPASLKTWNLKGSW